MSTKTQKERGDLFVDFRLAQLAIKASCGKLSDHLYLMGIDTIWIGEHLFIKEVKLDTDEVVVSFGKEGNTDIVKLSNLSDSVLYEVIAIMQHKALELADKFVKEEDIY